MAGKFALKKAPGTWVTPQSSEAVRRWVARCLRAASWIRSAVVRGTRNAVAWLQDVAIPAVRDSYTVRNMRRRPSEVAFFASAVVVAVAVGWLLIGVLRRLS